MPKIYLIALNGGFYYVGITSNLQKRLNDHKLGQGCVWTKIHPPILNSEGDIEPIKIIETNDPYDEDKEVKKAMKKYGFDKVRGGTYSTRNLSNEQIEFIKNEITHNEGGCFKCRSKEHFVKDCPGEVKEEEQEQEFCVIQ